jgi:hypothetical protein
MIGAGVTIKKEAKIAVTAICTSLPRVRSVVGVRREYTAARRRTVSSGLLTADFMSLSRTLTARDDPATVPAGRTAPWVPTFVVAAHTHSVDGNRMGQRSPVATAVEVAIITMLAFVALAGAVATLPAPIREILIRSVHTALMESMISG